MGAAMELKTMPLETAAEVLQFLAEHEDFSAVAQAVGEDLAVEEVRALLRELMIELRREAAKAPRAAFDVTKCRHLTGQSKQLISYLSPMEEKTLLGAFGLAEAQAGSPLSVLRADRKS